MQPEIPRDWFQLPSEATGPLPPTIPWELLAQEDGTLQGSELTTIAEHSMPDALSLLLNYVKATQTNRKEWNVWNTLLDLVNWENEYYLEVCTSALARHYIDRYEADRHPDKGV